MNLWHFWFLTMDWPPLIDAQFRRHLDLQPRKPVSFTSARRYSKDPGALWSREPPDFKGNSNCRLFAI